MNSPCSACGYAVEWLRSCYRSKWRLWQDRSIITQGRYVRAGDDAEVFPYWHNFGSKNWISAEIEPGEPLGEIASARQIWDNGQPPIARPLPILLGKPECITDGFRGEPADIPVTGGLPKGCYVYPYDVDLGVNPVIPDVTDRGVLRALATACLLSYDDPELAADTLAKLCTEDAPRTWVANGDTVIPGWAVANTETITIICISGTSSNQQLALQGINLVGGPRDNGRYSAVGLWIDAAREMYARMGLLNINPDAPIVICGHSYGGGVAQVMAADFRLQSDRRPIRVVTFGTPKPGDYRLQQILKTVGMVHVACSDDPLPGLPPRLDFDPWILDAFPLNWLAGWLVYRDGPGHWLLSPDGSLVNYDGSPNGLETTRAILAAAVAGITLPDFSGHAILTYWTRLQL